MIIKDIDTVDIGKVFVAIIYDHTLLLSAINGLDFLSTVCASAVINARKGTSYTRKQPHDCC